MTSGCCGQHWRVANKDGDLGPPGTGFFPQRPSPGELWLAGKEKNSILDCNTGNCLSSTPTFHPVQQRCLPAEDSGRHFCKEGWERAAALRPQPNKRFSLLTFISCAPTAGVGLGAIWSEGSHSNQSRWDFYAPLGEQNICGSVIQESVFSLMMNQAKRVGPRVLGQTYPRTPEILIERGKAVLTLL